jgi:predicted MFS family arabinose efflux permease
MAIPAGARALLAALRFTGAGTEPLRSLSETDWAALLRFCDESQLTLTVGALCGPDLPPSVRGRIENDARNNATKFARLKADFLTIAAALDRRGIDFAVLKGFTHSPLFTPDPLLRAQGDIDLWCRRERVYEANDALLDLGYVPYAETEDRHLPPLRLPSNWEWRGDFYDPELPVSVDLHYRLWDDALERIAAPGVPEFWDRRIEQRFEGRSIPTLGPADALAFAALHQLLHVLRGDARLQRAWEIGYFLHTHAGDDEFWKRWREMHPDGLRRLETIVFRMSAEWFGCALSDCVKDEMEQLPDDVKLWFRRHAFAPVENLFQPNKHELWLHLALVDSFAGRASVFRRRVLPFKRVGEKPNKEPVSWRKRMNAWGWAGRRALRHAQVLPGTSIEGVRWWWMRQELGGPFLNFLFVSVLFDLGAFIFFVLYNLYLIDLGFREQFIGFAASAMTAGTLVMALPAAAIARKFGTRNTLMIATLGGAIASALRVALVWEKALIATAFLNGAFFCLWAVCLSPSVAGLTTEKNRNFGFSLVFSLGIGLGVVAGVAAGYLPALFGAHLLRLDSLGAKRAALYLACGVVALATLAAVRLRFPPPAATEEKKIYPRNSFVVGFLIALFVWIFATGIFNPFFNAYFSRHGHLSVAQIGFVFSASQATQVGAVLLSPLCFRWLGQVRGVALMQLATALALAAMAISPAGSLALIVYPLYMAFQYMSGPGVYSMLMGRVRPSERNGASALNFTVSSLAGMVASFGGGIAIAHLGYPVTMGVAAMLAGVAALLFRLLIKEEAA